MTLDVFDVQYAAGASGALAAFNQAGVLTAADVHVAATLGRLVVENDERALLAAALAVRGVRLGSVCVDLAAVRGTATADTDDPFNLDTLPWPKPADWYEACAVSPLFSDVGANDRPLRLVDGLLYLDRYWRQEEQVRADLAARTTRPPPVIDDARLRAALHRLFAEETPNYQRLAAAACATGWVTVVAGGPGTGKTTTVARLLAVLDDVLDVPPRVALAAPTGKAAARLEEAVAEQAGRMSPRLRPVAASTLHRLLGWRPGSHSRFRHDRTNRLPHDVVVVDETSMVSLTLMARLLDAVRPDARLVLVGDPDQLASVEAGAVLGDLVHRPARSGPDPRAALVGRLVPRDLPPSEVDTELGNDVVRLRTTYRFGGTIGELAEAIRTGRPDDVLAALRRGAPDVAFVEASSVEPRVPVGLDALRHDVETAGRALVVAARAGDVTAALDALERHRLLCAHRRGPYGVTRWADEVERWLAAAIEGYAEDGEWYRGRPLLVTENDYELKLYNGDTGVVVDGGLRGSMAAFRRGGQPVLLPPSRLSVVQTVHAMTVHRGQGSQFRRVTVLLPPADSALLTRELLYTAVTRATDFVRVIGTEDAVRTAVERPIVRASGLRRR